MNDYEESARFLERILDKMKYEPGKSPFDEMVIDFLEALAFDVCVDHPGRKSGE